MELLVVIAIIGTLVALLLPAVQAARESARKMRCGSHLHQIGLAIQQYHDVNQSFPPGGITLGPCCDTPSYTSWPISILPYIEKKDLFRLYNQRAYNEEIENEQVRTTFIPLYMCPSDLQPRQLERPESGPGNDATIKYAPGSYRGMGGKSDGERFWDELQPTSPPGAALPKNWRGVFHTVDGLKLTTENFASITDGSSQTIAVGEYSGASKSRPRRRTLWAYTYGSFNKSDAVAQSRTLLNDYERCVKTGVNDAPCKRGWSSFHTSGINFLFCDGSIRFLSTSIDMHLFTDLATVAGGEAAQAP